MSYRPARRQDTPSRRAPDRAEASRASGAAEERIRWPLTAPASGEHSQAIAAAISSGRVSVGFSSPIDADDDDVRRRGRAGEVLATEIVSASTAAFEAA